MWCTAGAYGRPDAPYQMIHHVNVQISDREQTRAWYEKVTNAARALFVIPTPPGPLPVGDDVGRQGRCTDRNGLYLESKSRIQSCMSRWSQGSETSRGQLQSL